MDRIVLYGRRDEYHGYMLKHSFLSLGCDGVFCMSPSMDPHLYVCGCARICVCITQIYILCLVAMSKFESYLHGSMLYFSSHEFFVSHMDLCCIGRQPCCVSFGTCIKMCCRNFVMFEKFLPLDLCIGTIPCSFKVYCLSFPSIHYNLGGISVTPKSHHHHVMRQVFP